MNRALATFLRPIAFDKPRHRTPLSAWKEHIPFAFNLVSVLRPRTIVELGTHAGDSYCAFCQAVVAEGLPTRCWAIDTWEGDAHTGRYGPEVLASLRAHHDPLYGGFSRLLRSTFREGLEAVRDGTVDLLHIDGAHTYEAVLEDFSTWLPKMTDAGVVLFHDTAVRERDFGVWRVWEELRARHPHFEFHHGHGLGVLSVGSAPRAELGELFAASEEDAGLLRRCFSELGQRLTLVEERDALAGDLAATRAALAEERTRREHLEARLGSIASTRGYALLERWRGLRDAMLPAGSRRRRIAARVLGRRDDDAIEPPPIRVQAGHCSVCDRATRFVARHEWLRDHYRCESCGSIPRERALMAVLGERYPRWRQLRIHESSPGTAVSRRLRAECPGYVPTHLFADVPAGAMRDGVRCEDLERQTFPDGCFDLVVTLDVLEHVFDWDAAFREIARTLAAGGAHVFTTPRYRGLARSERRARRTASGVEHLLPPEYHGNPIDPAGSIVTVHWGDDIVDIIQRASGLRTDVCRLEDPARGIEGEFLDVFVSAKPPADTALSQASPARLA